MNRLFDRDREVSVAEKSRLLDCFYTNNSIAELCIKIVREHCGAEWDLWVEPSAGAGAFFDLMPDPKIGLDIDLSPRPDILQADFLEWTLPQEAKRVIVVGNPPFGKNSSLAVKFFNHAAGFADTIAMIHPRTFQKESTIRRLDPYFHLIVEKALPLDSFTLQGAPYSVPCVFQIWSRQTVKRVMESLPTTHPDFRFTVPSEAHFALQRVGANAGRLKPDVWSVSPNSHYFIVAEVPGVEEALESIDWTEVKHRTAGNPSLAKSEIVSLYEIATKQIGVMRKVGTVDEQSLYS